MVGGDCCAQVRIMAFEVKFKFNKRAVAGNSTESRISPFALCGRGLLRRIFESVGYDLSGKTQSQMFLPNS